MSIVTAPKMPERPNATHKVVRVSNVNDLNSGIAASDVPTEFVLETGSEFKGRIIIPDGKKSLILRASGDSVNVWFPMEGALQIGHGCQDITVSSITFRLGDWVTPSQKCYVGVNMGYSTRDAREATRLEELPNRVSLFNVDVFGRPTQELRIGYLANARNLTMQDCTCAFVQEAGADSQGILVSNSPGPFLFSGCHIEAAGENIMFGEGFPRVPGIEIGDITIENCALLKPLEWKGSNWQIKNLLEFKAGVRASVTGCLLRNCWVAAQSGISTLITPRYGNKVGDISIYGNVFDNVHAGIHISAADDLNPTHAPIGPVELGSNFYTNLGEGYVYRISSPDGRKAKSIWIEDERWYALNGHAGALVMEGKPKAAESFGMVNCTGSMGRYGMISDGGIAGTKMLESWFDTWKATGNVLFCATRPAVGVYPDGIQTPKAV